MPDGTPAKFTKAELSSACDQLGMLQYWREETRPQVMLYLARICPHREALDWLVAQLVNFVGHWPGPAEVRGILCNRYDPADGIAAYSTVPGYRAEDAEMRYIERERERFTNLLPPAEALAQLVEPGAEPSPLIKQLVRLSDAMREHKPTPPNAYELGIIEREANDERLSDEARQRAKRLLDRETKPQ